jgi:hypothetical protein
MSVPAYGAPEVRYSDRDVREDQSLMNLAMAYIDVYGGDFEPLVAAKSEFAAYGSLTTRTARVVLNCMRYDVNVSASLPAPQRPALVYDKPRNRRRRSNEIEHRPCLIREPHYTHMWTTDSDDLVDCPGIPYEINRSMYQLPARIKKPYTFGRGATSLIHRTTGEGYLTWHPNWHGYGFIIPPVLHVRTACIETTRTLKNPALMDRIPQDEETWRERCHQGCFPDE